MAHFLSVSGLWVSHVLYSTLAACADPPKHIITRVAQCLLPSVCMAIVCCSLFILAPCCLIVEPKSPQSLKIIYQVLKFAIKHKSPLNRSAFTYWEENMPSRLDLGKFRYGGKFTTEQVEAHNHSRVCIPTRIIKSESVACQNTHPTSITVEL